MRPFPWPHGRVAARGLPNHRTMPFAALDAALAAFAVGAALAVRPWRMVYGTGPPWVWVVAWATLPVLWCLDRQLGVALPPPLSGAALLVLLTGWPLAVLACVPMAILMGVCGALDALDALHRMVWLGIVPATAALALGAATRRWLRRHGAGCRATLRSTCSGAASSAPACAYGSRARSLARWWRRRSGPMPASRT